MTAQVRVLERAEVQSAAEAISSATVRDGVDHGATFGVVNEGQVDAVAVWMPPGTFPWTARRELRAAPELFQVLLADPRAYPRFVRLGANAERLHPVEPHWYHVVLSVRRGLQRSGYGARLVTAGIERADADGLPCYLETSDPANVPYYERFGFTVGAEAAFVPGGPPHITMWRRTNSPIQSIK